MSVPFTIRPATHADLPRVRELLASACLTEAGLADQFGPGFAVAEADGCVIGTVGIERYGEYGLLRSAVVDPQWRGCTVGQALARDRVGWAKGQGLSALYLLTTTAGGYFPRFGFEAVSRDEVPPPVRASVEFAGACPASALAMRLPLRP